MLTLIPFTAHCSMTRAMLITCKACNCETWKWIRCVQLFCYYIQWSKKGCLTSGVQQEIKPRMSSQSCEDTSEHRWWRGKRRFWVQSPRSVRTPDRGLSSPRRLSSLISQQQQHPRAGAALPLCPCIWVPQRWLQWITISQPSPERAFISKLLVHQEQLLHLTRTAELQPIDLENDCRWLFKSDILAIEEYIFIYSSGLIASNWCKNLMIKERTLIFLAKKKKKTTTGFLPHNHMKASNYS